MMFVLSLHVCPLYLLTYDVICNVFLASEDAFSSKSSLFTSSILRWIDPILPSFLQFNVSILLYLQILLILFLTIKVLNVLYDIFKSDNEVKNIRREALSGTPKLSKTYRSSVIGLNAKKHNSLTRTERCGGKDVQSLTKWMREEFNFFIDILSNFFSNSIISHLKNDYDYNENLRRTPQSHKNQSPPSPMNITPNSNILQSVSPSLISSHSQNYSSNYLSSPIFNSPHENSFSRSANVSPKNQSFGSISSRDEMFEITPIDNMKDLQRYLHLFNKMNDSYSNIQQIESPTSIPSFQFEEGYSSDFRLSQPSSSSYSVRKLKSEHFEKSKLESSFFLNANTPNEKNSASQTSLKEEREHWSYREKFTNKREMRDVSVSDASSLTPTLSYEKDEICRWMENLRMWISQTILSRLIREIVFLNSQIVEMVRHESSDNLNQTETRSNMTQQIVSSNLGSGLSSIFPSPPQVMNAGTTENILPKLDLSHVCLIGKGSLDRVKHTLTTLSLFHLRKQERVKMDLNSNENKLNLRRIHNLLTFIDFGDSSSHEYIIQRITQLAEGGAISSFKWDGGYKKVYDSEAISAHNTNIEWSASNHHPTDSEIVMHCFVSYFDTVLPPKAVVSTFDLGSTFPDSSKECHASETESIAKEKNCMVGNLSSFFTFESSRLSRGVSLPHQSRVVETSLANKVCHPFSNVYFHSLAKVVEHDERNAFNAAKGGIMSDNESSQNRSVVNLPFHSKVECYHDSLKENFRQRQPKFEHKRVISSTFTSPSNKPSTRGVEKDAKLTNVECCGLKPPVAVIKHISGGYANRSSIGNVPNSRPHYVLTLNNGNRECSQNTDISMYKPIPKVLDPGVGPCNVFVVILLFLHAIHNYDDGILEQLSLGPSALNVMWVIDK